LGRGRFGSRARHGVCGGRRTGGQVLGAFAGDRLAGFTLAVVGIHDKVFYLHSHMTGVHSDYRDRGVGRMLKLFQRDDALRRDIA